MQHAKSIKFPKQNQLQKRQEGRRNWGRKEKGKVEEAQQKKSRQRRGERCTGDCEELWAESATFLLLCVGGGKTYGRIRNMPIHRTNYAEKEIANPLPHTATAPPSLYPFLLHTCVSWRATLWSFKRLFALFAAAVVAPPSPTTYSPVSTLNPVYATPPPPPTTQRAGQKHFLSC